MSNVPAIPSGLPEGLEDTEASDLSMPIYRIDHEAGCFVNNLTNEEFPEFDAILLGRLKQRILWPMDPGGGAEGPMCRSYDFNTGIPRAETWVQSQKGNSSMTAVKLSGFDFPTVEAAAEGGGLPCASCALKEWGDNRTPPWCNEQYTFPFLRVIDGDTQSVGVISFVRTGIKPCKSYVSGFVQAKSALYTVVTRIKAVPQSRGSVSWVVPSFQRIGDSDATQWPEYSRALHSAKTFLTTPYVRREQPDPDEDEVTNATTGTRTVTKPAPAPSTTAPTHPTPTTTTAATEQVAPPVARAAPVQEAKVVTGPTPAADFDDEEEPF